MRETLDRAEAVPLAYCLAAAALADAGVRALAIKGPVASYHELRDEYLSSDADIIVEYAQFARARSVLHEFGWKVRFERPTPSIVPAHSISYYHPDWPVDIDLHFTYPGCFAPFQLVFDEFWERRQRIPLAGVEILSADLTSSILVAALHAERHPRSPRHQAELLRLIEYLRRHDDRDRLTDDLIDLARRCDAIEPLGPLFASLGVELREEIDPERERLWKLYASTHDFGSLAGWLVLMRNSSWSRKWRVLRTALVPTGRELRDDLRTRDLGLLGRLAFLVNRLRQAVRRVLIVNQAIRTHGNTKDLVVYR